MKMLKSKKKKAKVSLKIKLNKEFGDGVSSRSQKKPNLIV